MIGTLWVLIIVLIVVAGLFLVLPTLLYRESHEGSGHDVREQKNRELYEQRLQELERDSALQLLPEGEFEKIKTELQRGFLSDMTDVDSVPHQADTALKKFVPLVLVLLIPVVSVYLYQQIGASNDLALPGLIAQLKTAETEQELNQSLDELADALSGRFTRHSDDVVTGYQLGNIYIRLERYDEAVDTFTALAQQMEDNPDKATVLGQLAQAKYLTDGSVMTRSTEEVIEQALALDPEQYSVLSILAMEAFIDEDLAAAVGYWRRQLRQEMPGSGQARMLAERIAQIETLMPEVQQETAGKSSMTDSLGAAITVSVSLDASLVGTIPQDMRLFVFARGEVMPMPLAAQSFTVDELPLTITLDDSMAMTPQFTLSNSERVFVGASIGSTAVAQSGDYRVVSPVFEVAQQSATISLVLKDKVP